MESPTSKQLTAPLLSGDNEFLEYEKEEEHAGEEEAGGKKSGPSSALMNCPTDEEGSGAAAAGGPLELFRRRSPRRHGDSLSSLCDPLLASSNGGEAHDDCERQPPPTEEATAASAPRTSFSCCQSGNFKNAAVTASLVVLWVLAACFVSYQSSLHNGSGGGSPSSRNDDDDTNLPPLKLATELATLSWLVYRFRDIDDPATVCPIVRANYSHILDPTSRPGNGTELSTDDKDDDDKNALDCHWYFHDRTQGTQVLLVSTPTYLAIVFSGTDDVQTSLTDVDLFTAEPSFFNFSKGYDPRIRIHSGFHQAVFAGGILSNVTHQLRAAMDAARKNRRGKVPWYRRWRNQNDNHNRGPVKLYTTGHSLGGANAILTALALQATARQQQQQQNEAGGSASKTGWDDDLAIQSISFGCPRIGNMYWRDFANGLSAIAPHSSPIVRVVLGWDLVPRLPEFLLHVGHTFQLSKSYQWIVEGTEQGEAEEDEDVGAFAPSVWNTSVYYHHYGDPDRGYSGVPLGWSATPFLWVPGALSSHSIRRYVSTLANMTDALWAADFVRTPSRPVNPKNVTPSASNASVDDDFYAEPPTDHEAISALSATELREAKAEFDEMSSQEGDDAIGIDAITS
jgi:Lipase (class 3)